MSAEWRISADDRARYETYFHQCAPTQGYLTGDQARAFFLKSNLSADVLRKIWDLADLNNDGRLDKREFAIACHLIASQVQKRAALPATLPPTLLADVLTIKTNGVALTPQPLLATGSFQFPPVKAPSLLPLTPTVRSKYLQQFHALVDVSKGNTFLNGAQARTLLQQTHLSQTLLHQIWNLADADRDGRLTADEFVVAMHCCDVARAGQTLPIRLPDDWSHGKVIERERSASIQLFDQDASTGEILRKNSLVSYEDKRQKNYQDGQRELERRRQMLREQEERDQREREERDKKREFDLQRQKEEQERLKQLEIERHLERQRQIEQQKEDERRKAFEQREAARKEMERRSRLEWERQRMQELSAQKSRLFEQINDFKSRAKAFDLEIQSMDESAATGQRRVQQNQTSVQTIDQAIVDLQKKTIEEKNSFVNLEQQRKDLLLKLKRIQNERETIETTYRQMSQSKGFDRQESDQMRTLQAQIQSIRQENTRTDEQIQNVTQQCQTYQRQMEQLRSQLTQLEQEAKTKNTAATAKRVTFSPQASLVAAAAPARSSPIVDPFQNVDPFAFPTDLASPSSISARNTISSIIQGDPFASSSPALKKREAPKVTPISNGKTSFVRYRALYDYTPTRPDELPVTTGDVILVNPAAQQSADWLEGQLENGKRGYFPANYAEPISRTETTTPASTNNNSNNRNQFESASTLTPGSWVIAVADCQGKTPDKHLTFQRGDPILVQTQRDNTWYSGQLHGKVGWFPRNHVRPATEQEIPASPAAPPPPPLESPSSNNGNTNSGVAEVYVALHAYEATEPTDLSFGAGERITVLERDGDWWVGRIGQRSGTFPRNYVEKVETPQQETATAILPFQSFDEGRLSFEVGQLIYIRKKGDKGWYQGEIRNSDQPIRVGWFPANCVQNQSITSTQSYLNTTKENPRYIALFPYTAQQSDELSFPAEAILEVLDETDSNWFSARYNNQVGLVPATYVQPYHQNSSTTFVSTPTLPDSNNITTTSVSDAETSISLSSNPSRISAVRELIETEQRYIDDLQIVNRDFIDTLKHVDVLSDHESTQIFLNWQDLIVRNSILLNALKDQVDYKDSPPSGPTLQTPSFSRNNRSVSMSNITLAALPTIESLAQKRMSHAVDPRQRSFTPSDLAQASPQRRTKHRNGSRHRSPSTAALAALPTVQFDTSSASMTIHDGTQVGQILCEHLPQMSEDYFHYCNSRSQANRILQTKIDSSENFRTCMKIFQERNGGLSLNGFLTKPIQRVTRYPLLIEKILKHTPADHSDYVPVKEALEAARKINEQINQQISEQESQTRLDWLEQHLAFGSDDNNSDGYVFDEVLKLNSRTKYNVHRQLILHGLVMKVPGGKELLAFLFNDFLLFSTMKSSSSNWQTQIFEPKSSLQLKLYRMPILLMDVIIANDALNDQLSFSITTKIYEKPLVLKTQQTNVRTLWVKSINSAVEECQTAERSIMNDRLAFAMTDHKRDTKPAVARLLLVVQEAQDIMPSRINIDRHRSVDPYCEITVGSLALRTPFIKRTINPKWNAPMQFLLYDFHEDLIHISIFDHEFFSPNESLGSTSVHLTDILPYPLETFLHQPSLPFTKKIFLNNGPSVVIKFVIQLLHSSQ